MALPRPTFHRSDSQARFHEEQSPGGAPSANRQQNNSALPQMRSVETPRKDRQSTQWKDDWAEDDALDIAKAEVRSIIERAAAVNANDEIHVDRLIDLCNQIKQAQKHGYLDCVRQDAPNAMVTLGKRLAVLLNRLSADITSEKFVLSSLNSDDLHILFNGLSVITGESAAQSLLPKADYSNNQTRQSLGKIIEALLVHARDESMAQKHWDSSKLINVLNCLSRGLKQGIVSRDSDVTKGFFLSALKVMKTWAPVAGERAGATTLTAPLDTRQLGKCMVQIATAMKFSFIDSVEHRGSLCDLVLGLCGGSALDKCTVWKPADDIGQGLRLVLATVRPDGTEITNISNTIKDCLQAGVLLLDDDRVQTIIEKLCLQMEKIPRHSLLGRNGHQLSNCCNFLRQVFEAGQAAPSHPLKNKNGYEKLCTSLLDLIPQQMSQLSLTKPSEQTITNLISFVKAMDRSHVYAASALRKAASSLVAVLPGVIPAMHSVESYSATLGGLQHFAMRGLIPQHTALALMLSLLEQLKLKALAGWSAKSRAVLMRAAVYCWQAQADTPSAPLPPQRLTETMQALLELPGQIDDHFPYLNAVYLLAQRDAEWLPRHQQLVRALIAADEEKTISLVDVQRALKDSQAAEAVIEVLQSPTAMAAVAAVESKPQQDVVTKTSTPAMTPNPQERRIVGMTRLLPEQQPQQPPRRQIARDAKAAKSAKGARSPQRVARTASEAVKADHRNSDDLRPSPARAASQPQAAASAPAKASAKASVNASVNSSVSASTKAAPTLLPSTDPALVTRPQTKTSASVQLTPAKKPETPAQNRQTKQPQPVKQNKSIAQTKPVQKNRRVSPDEEWFELLRQEEPLSSAQIKRLELLYEEYPRLAAAKFGKGHQARSALFYALSTGKPDAVQIIMRHDLHDNMLDTIKAVFDEALMVGDAEVDALRVYFIGKSPMEFAEFKKAFKKKYPESEIRKTVPKRFLGLLGEFGLLSDKADQAVTPAVADSANDQSLSTAEKEKIIRDKQWNPLMVAVIEGNMDVVKSILRTDLAKEQTLAVCKDGLNALKYAAMRGHFDMMKLFLTLDWVDEMASALDNGLRNALMFAIGAGQATDAAQAEVIKGLLQLPSADNQAIVQNEKRWNSLMLAASRGRDDLVGFLLELDSALAQAMAVNEAGRNALIIAARQGHDGTVKLLLKIRSAERQIQAKDKSGANALMLAAAEGHAKVVNVLLETPFADEQARALDSENRNALMFAAAKGKEEIVDKLLSLPSAAEQLKAVNAFGMNALMVAQLAGHWDIATSLARVLR